ncbi:hypothetical protein ACFLYW_00990 [Thermodesulfobacteriota bacterium]
MNKKMQKITVWTGGLLALLGFSSSNSLANVDTEQGINKVTETTPLYLIHADDLASQNKMLSWHYSHSSHESHWSHSSHSSHYSHYSSRW